MSSVRNDLTGKRVGRLFVQKLIGQIKTRSVFKCKCDCGEIAIVTGSHLSRALKGNGGTQSCGCLRRELGIEKAKRMRGES